MCCSASLPSKNLLQIESWMPQQLAVPKLMLADKYLMQAVDVLIPAVLGAHEYDWNADRQTTFIFT